MENYNFFIPKKCKVGFNYREDTYSKYLAYVIYYDEKNKLRKEKSWNTWVQTKEKEEEEYQKQLENKKQYPSYIIRPKTPTKDPFEFENIPTSGFVLNKGVGGVKDSYSSWNPRSAYIRVFDPRGFEVEISVSNLLFILQETNSLKGKGLEGEFVYSWFGAELYLLPTCSNVYKQSKEYCDKLFAPVKIKKKDLKVNDLIEMNNGDQAVYLGVREITLYEQLTKHELFYNVSGSYFFTTKTFSNISRVILSNYNEIPIYDMIDFSYLSPNRYWLNEVVELDKVENEQVFHLINRFNYLIDGNDNVFVLKMGYYYDYTNKINKLKTPCEVYNLVYKLTGVDKEWVLDLVKKGTFKSDEKFEVKLDDKYKKESTDLFGRRKSKYEEGDIKFDGARVIISRLTQNFEIKYNFEFLRTYNKNIKLN